MDISKYLARPTDTIQDVIRLIEKNKDGIALVVSENGQLIGSITDGDIRRYLLAGKARCEHLVVGITNPDPTLTREDEADPQRSIPSANPLTYFERYVMIRAALGVYPSLISVGRA